MKILFYRYGSICEPDMINALSMSGFEIIEEKAEITNKNLSQTERVNLVEKHIKESHPMFVISINFYPVIADICKIYDTIYIGWTVDSPVPELFSKSINHSTNRMFLFDKAQYVSISPYTDGPIFYLPLAAATYRFDEVIASIDDSDRRKFSSDISFVGSLYTEKDPLVNVKLSEYTDGFINGLTNATLCTYGYNPVYDSLNGTVIDEIKELTKFVMPDAIRDIDRYVVSHCFIGYHISSIERIRTLNALAKYFNVDLYTRSDTSVLEGVNIHEGVKTLTEMPKVFNLSKINLNMTIRPIESGLPLRIFDILGCGGFLMTNYQTELTDMFDIGVDLEAYASIEELIDKCDYYLTHDSERMAIARRGYEKVASNHTYFHRIKEMLTTIL